MASEAPITSSKDSTQTTASAAQPAPPSSKPQVSIQPGSHLDPGAYVRGSHPITIGQNVLIHPRAHLLSIHSPLIIGDGCVVSEKCVLGGPLPTAAQLDKPLEIGNTNIEKFHDEVRGAKATIIGDLVHLHSSATVNHGATINTGSVIESNTTILSDIVVGSHSKICATLTISNGIPDWTVVWGTNTNMKRRSRVSHSDSPKDRFYEAVEDQRIKAMQRERDGTIAVLRNAASKNTGGSNRSKK